MHTELTDNSKKSALAAIINLDTSSLSAADLMLNEFESDEVITSLLFLLAFNNETNNKLTLDEQVKDILVTSCYEHLSKQSKYEFNTQWLYKIIDNWGADIIQALIPRHFFQGIYYWILLTISVIMILQKHCLMKWIMMILNIEPIPK